MAATTTVEITWLVDKLQVDYPRITLESGQEFSWSPSRQVVTYIANAKEYGALLHEVAHAILDHATYKRDLELLHMERDAWHYASKELAPRYGAEITDQEIQDSLDTYREWLHARSTCPSCHATGIGGTSNTYRCAVCHETWRVNDARTCALRRYKTTT